MQLDNIVKEYWHFLLIILSSNVHSLKIANMLKQGGKQEDEDTLSFVSGPANLEDAFTSTDKLKLTVEQSRDEYISFLTIINVATQQLWVHLIKIKGPLILYIDAFLKQHLIQQTYLTKAIITPSGQG